MSRKLDLQRRREELADRAFPHFAAQGYHALGLRDLARRMGLTTGALYHYFESKPALFRQAVRGRIEAQIAAALRELAPAEDRAMALVLWLAEREEELLAILRVGLDFRHAAEPGRGEPGRGEPGEGDPGEGDPGEGDPAVFIRRMLQTYQGALVEHLGLSEEGAALWVDLSLGILTRRLLDPQAPGLRVHLPAFAALRALPATGAPAAAGS